MIITPHYDRPMTPPVQTTHRTAFIAMAALLLALIPVWRWQHVPTPSPTVAATTPPDPGTIQDSTNTTDTSSTATLPITTNVTVTNSSLNPPLTTHQKEVKELIERKTVAPIIRSVQWNSMRQQMIDNSKRRPEDRDPSAPTEKDLLKFQADSNLIML